MNLLKGRNNFTNKIWKKWENKFTNKIIYVILKKSMDLLHSFARDLLTPCFVKREKIQIGGNNGKERDYW